MLNERTICRRVAIGVLLHLFLVSTTARSAAGAARPEANNVMCGPHCLWLMARSCGVVTRLDKMVHHGGTDPRRGTSLQGMVTALQRIGLYPLVIKADWDALQRLGDRNAILLLGSSTSAKSGHYVFMYRLLAGSIRVIDSPHQREWSPSEFLARYNGIALVAFRDDARRHAFQATLSSSRRPFLQGGAIAGGGTIAGILVIHAWLRRRGRVRA